MLIDGHQVDGGMKRSWSMPACDTVLGQFGVPITVMVGVKPGPTLAVTAACHPMELNGVVTSIRLKREIDPEVLAGTLLIVHVQNIFGFQAKKGHISAVDGVNMGRAFPVPAETETSSGFVSHQTKSPTYQIADKIFHEVTAKADYLIDLHGGELSESLYPNIEIKPTGTAVDERSRFLAQAFGFDYIWEVPKGSIVEMPDYPGRGSGVLEACLMGIPGAICEVGGEGKIEPSLVDFTVQGIKNVMAHLDMIPGEKVPPDATVLVGGNVLFGERGGLHLSEARAGDRLHEGQKLGELIDLSGDVVQTFIAPHEGILLNKVTLDVVNPGDMLYVIGNVVTP
jgi:uncharacterized protein